ncbi:MAG: DegT/DnrJ/EryC1/StrS family aminotransferase [bacterium]
MNKYLKKVVEVETKYKNMLHLGANENVLSPLAERMFQSSLHNRYYMGPGEKGVATFGRNAAFKGMPEIERILDEAHRKAEQMLHAGYVSFSCLSGAHAMISSLLSLTQPGDTIMSVPSNQGGHFCTKGIIERTGRKHVFTEYDRKKLTFDVEKIAKICKDFNVKAIYLDVSVYLNPHPIRELRKAVGPDIFIFYDASHTLGLIMGGVFQSPLEEGANVICANTHKTFPGPHRGLIAFKDGDLGRKTDHFITHNFVSTIQTNSLLSLAVTVLEFNKWGKKYAVQVVKNANVLAKWLTEAGLRVRNVADRVYTKNHQIHVYIDIPREEAIELFLRNNISVNTSGALGDKLFLRIGLQEITKRGMKEKDMKSLADFIIKILKGENVLRGVNSFSRKFQKVDYGFNI